MNNLRIYLSLVDGSQFPLESDSGRELIGDIFGDDMRPPPKFLVIEATAMDGRVARISVFNGDSPDASVQIE
jgi:hypothetical protein